MVCTVQKHTVNNPSASLEQALRRADVKAATAFARSFPNSPSLITPVPSTGFLPLHYAALLGDSSLIGALLSSTLTAVDVKCLKIAASHGHTRALSELMRYVTATVIQNAGEAVFEASYRGSIECVRTLVSAGAPTDFRAADGSTPLHLAAMSGSIAMVDCLLHAGASPFVVSENGSTPALCAQRIGDLSVVGRLKAAMVEIEDSRNRACVKVGNPCDAEDEKSKENSQFQTPGISPTMSDDGMACDDIESESENVNDFMYSKRRQ